MSKKGWVNMEFPRHQNAFLKTLKVRLRKNNMAQVLEELMRSYDGDLLDNAIESTKLLGLYQPIEEEEDESANTNHG